MTLVELKMLQTKGQFNWSEIIIKIIKLNKQSKTEMYTFLDFILNFKA